MIKHVVILLCDCCGQEIEEKRRKGIVEELLYWAGKAGWWSDPDSTRHYCPECKVSARLALARKTEEVRR